MKVVIKEANAEPYTAELDNTLEALQKSVDGFIQVVHPKGQNFVLIVNEEGKLNGLPLNLIVTQGSQILDVIVGTVIAVGTKGDEFRGLTKKQAAAAMQWLTDNDHRPWKHHAAGTQRK